MIRQEWNHLDEKNIVMIVDDLLEKLVRQIFNLALCHFVPRRGCQIKRFKKVIKMCPLFIVK